MISGPTWMQSLEGCSLDRPIMHPSHKSTDLYFRKLIRPITNPSNYLWMITYSQASARPSSKVRCAASLQLVYWLSMMATSVHSSTAMKSGKKQSKDVGSGVGWWSYLGAYCPRYQDSWGQYGAHLGLTGSRWAPCWPHELCYLG